MPKHTVEIDDQDRMIDIRFVMAAEGFKSPTTVYAAEARGDLPPSIKTTHGRRWRLVTYRAHVAAREAAAISKANRPIDPLS